MFRRLLLWRNGGIVFLGLGVLYVTTAGGQFPLSVYFVIAGPLIATGLLFPASSIHRSRTPIEEPGHPVALVSRLHPSRSGRGRCGSECTSHRVISPIAGTITVLSSIAAAVFARVATTCAAVILILNVFQAL